MDLSPFFSLADRQQLIPPVTAEIATDYLCGSAVLPALLSHQCRLVA